MAEEFDLGRIEQAINDSENEGTVKESLTAEPFGKAEQVAEEKPKSYLASLPNPFEGERPEGKQSYLENLPNPFETRIPRKEKKAPKILTREERYEAFREGVLSRAVPNILQAMNVPVEQEQKARLIGEELNIPASVISSDMKRYERQYITKQNASILRRDSTLLSFTSVNPQEAKMLWDDLNELSLFSQVASKIRFTDEPLMNEGIYGAEESKVVKGMTIDGLPDFGRGLVEAPVNYPTLNKYAGDLGNWFDSGRVDAKPENPMPQTPDTWGYAIGSGLGQLPVQLGYSAFTKKALERSTQGLAIGAGVGSAIGGVGAVGGGIGGVASGLAVGISEVMGKENANLLAGDVYEELVQNGVEPERAFSLANDVRTPSALSSMALEVLSNLSLVNRTASVVLAPVRKGIASQLVKSMLMQGWEEGTVEALQGAVGEGLTESAKMQAGVDNIYENPTWKKIVDLGQKVGTDFIIGGAVGALATGTAGATGHYIKKMIEKAPEALNTEQTIVESMDTAVQTKTHARTLDVFEKFAQTAFSGKPVYLDYEQAKQEYEADPELWKKVIPDIEQQLQESAETGSRINIPIGSMVTHLAGSEKGKALAGNLSASPDGATANEIREMSLELPDDVKQEIADIFSQVSGEIETPEQANRVSVKRTILDQLKSLRQIKPSDRELVAEFYVSSLEAQAKANEYRFGGVLEEYNRNPFVFQSVDEFTADSMAFKALQKQEEKNKKSKKKQAILPTADQGRGSVVSDRKKVKPSFKGTVIRDTEVKVGGEYIPASVMVVEADSLAPTLETDVNQPRARDRAVSEAQIEQYANDLDPNYLSSQFPDMVNGTPTLDPKGTIIGGNGRAEAIRRGYERGKADAYRSMVEAEASRQGIDAKGFKNPVLVRVFGNNVDVTRTAILSNEGSSAVQSSLEQANVDASRVGDIGEFYFNENGNLSRTGNEVPLRQFIAQYPVEEQGRFVDDEGHLSVEGDRRLRNAILFRAYGDSPLLPRMIEDLSPEGRNINNAMTRVAPTLANIEDRIARGELHNVSLRDDLLSAIEKYLDLSRKEQDVKSYLSQENLFGEDLSPEGKQLLQMLSDNIRSAKRLGDTLLELYQKIESFGNPQDIDLFGDAPVPTKQDILSGLSEDAPPPQMDIFNQSPRGRIAISDITRVIQVFREGDVSTLIHEGGHLFLDRLIQDATTAPEGMSAQLKEDYEITKTWFKESSDELLDMHEKKNVLGSGKEQRAKEKEMIKEIRNRGGAEYLSQIIDGDLKYTDDVSKFARDIFHEVFARGYERYLMEGKAPSSKLKAMFQRFSAFLVDLYKRVASLNAPINDDIREVFGRLLSAEQTTQTAIKQTFADPIFPDQESSGMGKAEYEAYTKKVTEQVGALREKVIQRNMKALRDLKNKESAERIEAIKEKRLDEMNEVRGIQSFNYIMGLDEQGGDTGKTLKIDKESVQGILSDEEINALPPEIFDAEGYGVDSVSNSLGYSGVKGLLNDLMNVEALRANLGKEGERLTIQQAKEKTAEKNATEEFKASLDPESLYDEAVDMLHESDFEDVLNMELNAITALVEEEIDAKQNTDEQTAELETAGQGLPETITLADLKKFIRTERSSGDKVQKGLRSGKGGNYFKAFLSRISQKTEQTKTDNALKDIREAQRRDDAKIKGQEKTIARKEKELEKLKEKNFNEQFKELVKTEKQKERAEAKHKAEIAKKEKALEALKEKHAKEKEGLKGKYEKKIDALKEKAKTLSDRDQAFRGSIRTIDMASLKDFVQSIFNGVDPKNLLRDESQEGISIREANIDVWGNETRRFLEPKQYLEMERKKADQASKYTASRNYEKGYIATIEKIIARLMHKEALKRAKIKMKAIDTAGVKEQANAILNSQSLGDASNGSKRYLNAERKAGAEAQTHLANGEFTKAVQAKRKQMFSHIVYKEALNLEKLIKKAGGLFSRIAKKKVMKGVHPDAMAILHRILNEYGYKTARSEKSSREGYFEPELEKYFVDENGNPVPLNKAIDLFKDKNPVMRGTVYIAEGLSGKENLTVSDFFDLYRSISSIYTHGKTESEVTVAEKKENKRQVIQAINEKAREGHKDNPRSIALMDRSSLTRWQEFKRNLTNIADYVPASVIRVATIFDRMDKNEVGGIMTSFMTNLYEGYYKFSGYSSGFKTITDNMRKKHGYKKYSAWVNGLNEQVKNTTLRNSDGTLRQLSKRNLIAMAFNVGSPSNFRALIRGRELSEDGGSTGWTAGSVMEILTDNLSEMDWEYASQVGYHMGAIWNDLSSLMKRINGFSPDKVATAPVETPFGVLEGWYAPLVYDDITIENEPSELWSEGFGNSLKVGSGIDRNLGVRRPVSLDFLDALNASVRTAYSVYMVEPVTDLKKVIRTPSFKKTLTDTQGEMFYKATDDWIKDIESPARRIAGMPDYVQAIGNFAFAGIVLYHFGFGVKQLADSTSDFAGVSVGNTGIPFHKYWGTVLKSSLKGAYRTMTRNHDGEFKWAFENFASLREIRESQMTSRKRFTRAVERRYGTPTRVLDAVRDFSTNMLEFTQTVTNVMLARTAHDYFIQENPTATQKEIVDYVNKVVRGSSPARTPLDASLVQRNKRNEVLKFLMNYSLKTFDNIYGMYTKSKDAVLHPAETQKQKGTRTKDAVTNATRLSVYAFISSAVYLALSGGFDEEDDATDVILKSVGASIMGVPLGRETSDILLFDNPFAVSNADLRFKPFLQSVRDSKRMFEQGDALDKKEIFRLMKLGGQLGHIPIKPINYGSYFTQGDTSGDLADQIKGLNRGY